jgi:hypothetical protein
MAWKPGQGGTQHRGPSKALPEWAGLVLLLTCFGSAITFLIFVKPPWAMALAIYVIVGLVLRFGNK